MKLLLSVDTKLISSVVFCVCVVCVCSSPHSVLSCLRRNCLSNFIRFPLFYLCTEEKLLSTHLEKLFFLTKKNSLVHEKEVHAKLGDNVSSEFSVYFSLHRIYR